MIYRDMNGRSIQEFDIVLLENAGEHTGENAKVMGLLRNGQIDVWVTMADVARVWPEDVKIIRKARSGNEVA